MSSRSVWDLDPELRQLCSEWVRRLTAEGIEVIVTCTYRSNEEQAELYAQGRTKPGRIVTNARPGQSKHNVTLPDGRTPAARAFDFVPLRGGKAVWGLRTAADRAVWERCVAVAESLGLRCGARFPRLQDWPHVEMAEGA